LFTIADNFLFADFLSSVDSFNFKILILQAVWLPSGFQDQVKFYEKKYSFTISVCGFDDRVFRLRG